LQQRRVVFDETNWGDSQGEEWPQLRRDLGIVSRSRNSPGRGKKLT